MCEPEECGDMQNDFQGKQHPQEISHQVINQSVPHIWKNKTKHVPVPFDYIKRRNQYPYINNFITVQKYKVLIQTFKILLSVWYAP